MIKKLFFGSLVVFWFQLNLPLQAQNSCPSGYKLTVTGYCRSLSHPLIRVSAELSGRSRTPSLTYWITNLVEVPVYVSRISIRFTNVSGDSTIETFYPNTVIPSGHSISKDKIPTSVLSRLKVNSATQVYITADTFDAQEQ